MDPLREGYKITSLPPELLELIFRNLTFNDVGKLRTVCRYFNSVGSSLLNSEFSRLRMNMLHRFQSIKAQMPRRESARRKHPLARESDIIETLHMRLTLLHMSFGKHIERKHCCFFAGEILDEVYSILRYVENTPTLNRAYKVTDELFDLSAMAMEYFKEHIEPSLPEITYFASDFLDYSPTLTSSASLSTGVSFVDDALFCNKNSVSKLPAVKKVKAVVPYHPPLTVTVNRKLRRMRETIKKNNTDLTALKQELKSTKRKMLLQQKQISDLKTRNEDYDKKFQNTSHKLSIMMQEVNRFKTEFQFWRSKSPATACSCGAFVPMVDTNDKDGPAASLSFENISPKDEMNVSHEFKPIISDIEPQPTTSYASKSDLSINETIYVNLHSPSEDSEPNTMLFDEDYCLDTPTTSTKPKKRKLKQDASASSTKKLMQSSVANIHKEVLDDYYLDLP